MKPTIIIQGNLARDILEASKVIRLSKEELLEQSLSLFLEWRLMGFCEPTNDEEKLKQIYEFAEKIFNGAPVRRCV